MVASSSICATTIPKRTNGLERNLIATGLGGPRSRQRAHRANGIASTLADGRTLSLPGRRAVDGHEDVAPAEQQTTTRRAVTPDLAGDPPSINGTHVHATQLRNFALGQKLFARGAVVPHIPPPSVHPR